MHPDDLPVLDEEPPRFLEVPARAVRPAGALSRGVAAVALIAVGIVAAGILNHGRVPSDAPASPPEAARAVVTAPAPATADRRGPRPSFGWPVAATSARPVEVIALASPGPGSVTVTSNRLSVAGRVLVRATRVEIVLAANGNRRFGEAAADVSDRDGGIRPDQPPGFAVQFDLAVPRPMGTMLVVVTAYDATGSPIGAVRRAITIGPPAAP